MSVAVSLEPPAQLFAEVRALARMKLAGFSLRLEGGDLIVSGTSRLTPAQRDFIQSNKRALVALLMDADVLHAALVKAGPAGLAWMKGTPADWTPERLLTAGEVLYGNGEMVSRSARRFLMEHAPPLDWNDDADLEVAP